MTGAFWVASLVVVVSPGAGSLLTLAAGLGQGRRAAVVCALGCTLGTLPHALAATTGAAAVLAASPRAYEGLLLAGAAYFFYLAWAILRQRGMLDLTGRVQPGWQVLLQAIGLNLLNPKLSLFFLAFLPQFVRPDGPGWLAQMLQLSQAFMGLTFVVFVAYGLTAAHLRDRVLGRPAVQQGLRYGFSLAFAGLGLMMLRQLG